MNMPLIEVTAAILHQDGQFLLQLRDDFPHIVYPGVWGFFFWPAIFGAKNKEEAQNRHEKEL